VESFDIDDAFLKELEEAEQRALRDEGGDKDEAVIDLEEESQVEILSAPVVPRVPRRVKVEEVIDISD
jgi:hypothetical protein